MTLKKFTLRLLLAVVHMSVHAGFEDGVNAFHRGQYIIAAQEWQPLATKGDPDAARNLAMLYHRGLGFEVDFIKARYWYKIAALKCNATAQNNLGLLLLNGQGGDKDLVGAFRLFEKAALQGLHADSDAMGNLAGMYLNGQGTQQNVIEAYKWYILYGEYTTDFANKQKLLAFMPQIEKLLTPTQKNEALRRVNAFTRVRCLP